MSNRLSKEIRKFLERARLKDSIEGSLVQPKKMIMKQLSIFSKIALIIDW